MDPAPPNELEVLKRATALQSIRFRVDYRFKVDWEVEQREYLFIISRFRIFDDPSTLVILKGFKHKFPVDFDLSVFPTLQSFSLDIAFSADMAGILVPKTFHIFNKMSGWCSIRDIVIVMTITNPDDITDILSSDEDWRLFDVVIT